MPGQKSLHKIYLLRRCCYAVWPFALRTNNPCLTGRAGELGQSQK